MDLTGAELDLVFAVANPNQFDIYGASMEAGLAVDEVELGRVVRPGPFTLAAAEETELLVPLSLKWSGVGAAARGALTSGEVNYLVDGRVYLETPFGEGRVPYRRSGTIQVLRDYQEGGN